MLKEEHHETLELRSRGSREGEDKFGLLKEVVLVSESRSQYYVFTVVEIRSGILL